MSGRLEVSELQGGSGWGELRVLVVRVRGGFWRGLGGLGFRRQGKKRGWDRGLQVDVESGRLGLCDFELEDLTWLLAGFIRWRWG